MAIIVIPLTCVIFIIELSLRNIVLPGCFVTFFAILSWVISCAYKLGQLVWNCPLRSSWFAIVLFFAVERLQPYQLGSVLRNCWTALYLPFPTLLIFVLFIVWVVFPPFSVVSPTTLFCFFIFFVLPNVEIFPGILERFRQMGHLPAARNPGGLGDGGLGRPRGTRGHDRAASGNCEHHYAATFGWFPQICEGEIFTLQERPVSGSILTRKTVIFVPLVDAPAPAVVGGGGGGRIHQGWPL